MATTPPDAARVPSRSASAPQQAVERLLEDRPSFHLGGGANWAALPQTLRVLAHYLRPAARTLETGCGASTVVFASSGAEHTAISPFSAEHEAVQRYCAQVGIQPDHVRFQVGSSDAVLPTLAADGPLDLVFVDGHHSFPLPIVDFHFTSSRIRAGGALVLDDIPIPAVAVVYRHLCNSPAWRLLEIVDERAAVFEKLGIEDDEDWTLQVFNRSYPDFSFVPRPRRWLLWCGVRTKPLRKRWGKRLPRLRKLLRTFRAVVARA